MSWFSKRNTPFAREAICQVPPRYPESQHCIELTAVTLQRGQQVLFEELNLCWHEQKVGLIGSNGSGKSSLIRLLNGLLLPDQGRVCVFGYDVAEQAAVMPGLVGFIFQNPDHQIIFPTVAEELGFGLEQLGQTAAQARAAALQLLTEQGLADWADQPVSQLSEGQKQRVCILAVLLMKPRLLVLDEPFAALDVRARNQLLQLLQALDTHLLLISHDLSVYADFDRLIWLEQGRIQADGPPQAVIDAYLASCHAAP